MTDPELLARLERLERDRDALHGRMYRLEQQPPPPAPPSLSGIEDRLAALERQVAASAPPAPSPATAPVDLSPLETRLSALESALGITEAP